MVNSLYIHFPFCKHLCNYCDFYKRKFESDQQISDYLELFKLQKSVLEELLTEHEESLGELETLYFGGGTPSLLKPQQMQKLLKLADIKFNKHAEFTIEVDPGTFTRNDIEGWIELGVNRFSFGLQAFDDLALKWLDRSHRKKDVEKSLEILDSFNTNVSFDLMIGTPGNPRKIEKEIHELIQFNPSHFSVYILSTRKNYPHLRSMPEEDTIRADYLKTCEALRQLGFDHYEVSNFAKNRKMRSRHNLQYWEPSSVAAIGPNASGTIYSHNEVFRYQWKSLSAGYQTESVSGSSFILELLFLKLRTSDGFSLLDYLDVTQTDSLQQIVEKWRVRGYVQPQSKIDDMYVTELGFLMNDTMLGELMPLF